jgi:hypothetical protein
MGVDVGVGGMTMLGLEGGLALNVQNPQQQQRQQRQQSSRVALQSLLPSMAGGGGGGVASTSPSLQQAKAHPRSSRSSGRTST